MIKKLEELAKKENIKGKLDKIATDYKSKPNNENSTSYGVNCVDCHCECFRECDSCYTTGCTM